MTYRLSGVVTDANERCGGRHPWPGEAKAPDEGGEEEDQEEVKQPSGEEKEDKDMGQAASASERRLLWLNMFNRRSASDTASTRRTCRTTRPPRAGRAALARVIGVERPAD